MADDPISENVDEAISRSAGLSTEKKKAADTGPIYRMMADSKIPVSKSEAGIWKSRRDSGKQAISNIASAWKEAEAYYSLGQDTHREDSGGTHKGNAKYGRNINRKYSSTENIVYSNVNAMIPAILAKNPQAEVTAYLKEYEAIAAMVEHLVNRLSTMKYAPGFNMKPKLRKSIMRCEISNEAWIMVGYTKKEDSADDARLELTKLGAELEKAKDKKEIEEIEGKLMALEETVDVLNPAGPFLKTFNGDKVLVDPTSTEDDFSDANWMMVEMMLPTKYLLAKYAKKDESGQWTAVFNDKYVINPGSNNGSPQEELNNFRILKETDTFRDAGYSSDEAFQKARMSKVWYCFDKVKRRFILIADEKWEWPLWVYDDPYQLPQFFPLRRLQYHTDPNKNRTKGEVSFYLDQQDELNDINSELNRMRTQILNKVLYDSRYIDNTAFDAYMKGGDQMGFGVGKNLPEGMKITDVIMAPPLPNLQYKELFDKTPIYAVVDRISSSNDILRGAQFKTNTTNDAIGTYNSIQNQRIDEKIDAIEDFAGDVYYDIAFLCIQFMTSEEVQYILGQEAEAWQQLEASIIRQQFLCTVLGGSTQKATSASKKDQALKMGQIMGQYAAATPYVTIIMLKAMEQAFDDIIITAEDWAEIRHSIEAKMMQGMSAPQPGDAVSEPGAQEQGQEQVPAEGTPQPDDNTPRGPANNEESVALEHAISQLPKEAQQAISISVEKGVPQQQAFAEVVKQLRKNPPRAKAPPQKPSQTPQNAKPH